MWTKQSLQNISEIVDAEGNLAQRQILGSPELSTESEG